MLVPINIDVSEFAASFDIPQDEINQFTSNIISELATEFAMHWSKAASVLKSSRVEYKNSIYVERIDDFNYIVGLNGWLPNAIEQGLSGFDQKEGFKSSSKTIWSIAKDKKTGFRSWYLTIPFRHAHAGAIGESSAFTNVMPSKVYKEAKKLETGEGLNVMNLSKEYQIKKIRSKVIAKSRIFEAYQHKHSIHSGIQRKKDTNRGTYVSFRRVSGNSDDDSWIHTGIQARNFAEKAMDTMNIADTVDHLTKKYIEQL